MALAPISLTFNFDDPAAAAAFLARFNGADTAANETPWYDSPEERDAATSERTASASPWDDDAAETQTASKGSADPWADDESTTTAKPDQKPSKRDGEGVLYPPAGSVYDKDTPNGNRHWEFGLSGAPDCDCGYPAAKVTGRKVGAKKDWSAWWCPVKYTKNYRDACKFSEFVN
jgi:hypothetical protein